MNFNKNSSESNLFSKKYSLDKAKDIFNDNNLFITKTNIPKNEPHKNKNKNKSHSPNLILDRTILLEKQKKKEKENEELKQNFLDFMEKNTNLININNVTSYYKIEEEKQKKIYDKNLEIISRKKKLLNDLNLKINQILINSVKIDKKYLEIAYDNEINTKRREIKLKKHELEMYHQLFGQTYKINYKLKNRLENEYKYQNLYNQQYEKYTILKNNTITKLQKQERMLNNLNKYFEKFISGNEELLMEKSKQLNKAEFEAFILKNDIVNIEKAIKNLYERNKELQKNIEKSYENLNLKKIDYIDSNKLYIKDCIKMENIYHVIDVENVGEILEKYKLLKQDYDNKSYKAKIKSLEIINLNSELKKKNEKLQNIYEQINELKKELASRQGNENEERIILKKSQIKYFISQIYDVLKEKINLFTQCVNNALSNISKIKLSMKNASIPSPFSYSYKFTDRFNIFLSEDRKSLNVDFEKELDENKLLLFVIYLIKSLYNFISGVNINVCYLLYNRIIKEKNIKKIRAMKEQSKELLLKIKEDLEDGKLEIYKLKSDFILQFYDKELNNIISHLNEKKKIYMRTPKDIFKKIYNAKTTKNSNTNYSEFSNNLFSSPREKEGINESKANITNKSFIQESNQKIPKKEKIILNRNQSVIAKDDFMKMYYTFYKNSLKSNKNLNKSLPHLNYTSLYSQRFDFINQFINDNVSEKLSLKKKEKKIKENIEKKSKAIKAKIREKEILRYMNKMNRKKIKSAETKDIDFDDKDKDKDISLDQEKKEYQQKLYLVQKKIEESKKIKKYKLKSAEPEMNIISERLDDLRALELYFSNKNDKNKKTVLDSSVFNEYYFKIKRILAPNHNSLRESLASNIMNKQGKINYKKLSKFLHHKSNSNIIRKYNSVYLDKNMIKKMGSSLTSKAIDNSTKEKTRQSFFRLTFINKNKKKEGFYENTHDNNILNNINKIEEK